MPARGGLPLFHRGEELRRLGRARRRARLRILVAAATAAVCTALIATLLWPPRPLLVWNASASSPVGLYRVEPTRDVRPGERIIAWPPDGARALADERHYLPRDV